MYDPATRRVQNSLFVHYVVPQKFRNCEIPGRTGGYINIYKNGGFLGVQEYTWVTEPERMVLGYTWECRGYETYELSTRGRHKSA